MYTYENRMTICLNFRCANNTPFLFVHQGLQTSNYFGSICQASTVNLGSGPAGDVYVPMRDLLPMVHPNDIVFDGKDACTVSLNYEYLVVNSEVISGQNEVKVDLCWFSRLGYIVHELGGRHATCQSVRHRIASKASAPHGGAQAAPVDLLSGLHRCQPIRSRG